MRARARSKGENRVLINRARPGRFDGGVCGVASREGHRPARAQSRHDRQHSAMRMTDDPMAWHCALLGKLSSGEAAEVMAEAARAVRAFESEDLVAAVHTASFRSSHAARGQGAGGRASLLFGLNEMWCAEARRGATTAPKNQTIR